MAEDEAVHVLGAQVGAEQSSEAVDETSDRRSLVIGESDTPHDVAIVVRLQVRFRRDVDEDLRSSTA